MICRIRCPPGNPTLAAFAPDECHRPSSTHSHAISAAIEQMRRVAHRRVPHADSFAGFGINSDTIYYAVAAQPCLAGAPGGIGFSVTVQYQTCRCRPAC